MSVVKLEVNENVFTPVAEFYYTIPYLCCTSVWNTAEAMDVTHSTQTKFRHNNDVHTLKIHLLLDADNAVWSTSIILTEVAVMRETCEMEASGANIIYSAISDDMLYDVVPTMSSTTIAVPM